MDIVGIEERGGGAGLLLLDKPEDGYKTRYFVRKIFKPFGRTFMLDIEQPVAKSTVYRVFPG